MTKVIVDGVEYVPKEKPKKLRYARVHDNIFVIRAIEGHYLQDSGDYIDILSPEGKEVACVAKWMVKEEVRLE